MKNPFKPEPSAHDRDNPLVPDAIERPAERAAERAAMHDNPLVPNAIERPLERAMADDRGHAGAPMADRRFTDDRAVDRPGPAAEHYRSTSAASVDERHHGEQHGEQIELFPTDELVGYRTRWDAIQTGFVDEPRSAVEQADALVSQVVNRLTDVFTRERSRLEDQWTRGDNVSTEDLRIALTRYRSFFHRLLSM